MTKIISALAGFLLAAGAVFALSADPVEGAPTTPDTPETVDAPVGVAHNFDNNSTYLCAALRPANTVLIHSWAVAWGTGWVRYWCMADFYGVSWQYWIEWNQDNGRAYRITTFQKCNQGPQGGTVWCGIAAHPI